MPNRFSASKRYECAGLGKREIRLFDAFRTQVPDVGQDRDVRPCALPRCDIERHGMVGAATVIDQVTSRSVPGRSPVEQWFVIAGIELQHSHLCVIQPSASKNCEQGPPPVGQQFGPNVSALAPLAVKGRELERLTTCGRDLPERSNKRG